MAKKRFVIHDKKLRELIKTNDIKIIRRNFFELLRRVARTITDSE